VNIKVKYFNKNLAKLEFKTKEATGFDLYSRLDVLLEPFCVSYLPLNVALKLPKNYWLMMAARSSLHKKKLMLINGIGVVDGDYCGDNDEYQAILYNFSNQKIAIKKGERLVQGILVKKTLVVLKEVERLGLKNRGGIGSTGSF